MPEESAMNHAIKHILFATDGSEYSAGAQRVALDLAKRRGARLSVMTIVLTSQDLEGVGTHGIRAQLETAARARLDAVADAARAQDVECDLLLAHGEEPHAEIVATARELGPDLIVLGRRGKRGLARMMVGHATAHVAGQAPCNVLMVPRVGEVWRKRVLLATDGSAHSRAASDVAGAVARQCGLPVTVLSAVAASHSELRKAEAHAAVAATATRLTQAGIACDSAVVEGRADEVVVETAASQGADLIVVGSHGRTGLARLFLGSISERIMGLAQCPVLIARASV
jgi:nucleotide-binding universal stress UspA family protein